MLLVLLILKNRGVVTLLQSKVIVVKLEQTHAWSHGSILLSSRHRFRSIQGPDGSVIGRGHFFSPIRSYISLAIRILITRSECSTEDDAAPNPVTVSSLDQIKAPSDCISESKTALLPRILKRATILNKDVLKS